MPLVEDVAADDHFVHRLRLAWILGIDPEEKLAQAQRRIRRIVRPISAGVDEVQAAHRVPADQGEGSLVRGAIPFRVPHNARPGGARPGQADARRQNQAVVGIDRRSLPVQQIPGTGTECHGAAAGLARRFNRPRDAGRVVEAIVGTAAAVGLVGHAKFPCRRRVGTHRQKIGQRQPADAVAAEGDPVLARLQMRRKPEPRRITAYRLGAIVTVLRRNAKILGARQLQHGRRAGRRIQIAPDDLQFARQPPYSTGLVCVSRGKPKRACIVDPDAVAPFSGRIAHPQGVGLAAAQGPRESYRQRMGYAGITDHICGAGQCRCHRSGRSA